MPETGSVGRDVPTESSATRSEADEPADRVPMTEEQLRAVTIGERMFPVRYRQPPTRFTVWAATDRCFDPRYF
jgi:hypothetical protein